MAFVAMDIEVTKADLRRFIALSDSNRDGRIDFNEFYSVLNSPDEDLNESELNRAGVIAEAEVDFEASFEKFD